MSEPVDRHGLEVLPLAQCLSLLRSRPLGRLAYVDAGTPVIVPVNHLVDGHNVVLRTLAGGKLDTAIMNGQVAFQIDDHDPARGTGWSVLVKGHAELVDDDEAISRYEGELDSWASTDAGAMAWIRIVADEISGRRLRRRDERTGAATPS